jgi:hypothetical protein
MKTIRIALILALGSCLHADSITKLERQHLVAHLEMTASWLVSEASNLSPAQLQFRPAPGTWSILDVLEHLNTAEPIYWQQIKDALKASPSGKKPQVTELDALWYGIDRTQRQKTSPDKEPKRLSTDAGARLEAFRKLHDEMLQYARTTEDDLRGHVLEQESCDAYQWLLVISTHTQRHILQIREIKANTGFPKK